MHRKVDIHNWNSGGNLSEHRKRVVLCDIFSGNARHASEGFLSLFLDVELCLNQGSLFVCHFPPWPQITVDWYPEAKSPWKKIKTSQGFTCMTLSKAPWDTSYRLIHLLPCFHEICQNKNKSTKLGWDSCLPPFWHSFFTLLPSASWGARVTGGSLGIWLKGRRLEKLN